jgi:C-terminal processing protease CtpA/Prc
MVAAFAKEHHLATLVGTTTAGEVMGGANFDAGDGYRLRIPITTWQTWDGLQIEKIGISPDVLTDFAPGKKDLQLESALKLTRA